MDSEKSFTWSEVTLNPYKKSKATIKMMMNMEADLSHGGSLWSSQCLTVSLNGGADVQLVESLMIEELSGRGGNHGSSLNGGLGIAEEMIQEKDWTQVSWRVYGQLGGGTVGPG